MGPRDTFHGPRLSVYSAEYSGVPVENMSSFCKTRTTYHQDRVLLRNETVDRNYLFELEEDWEWKDACEVFNRILKDDIFTVSMLKRDYALTMITVDREHRGSRSLGLSSEYGRTALSLRKHGPTGGRSQRQCSQTQLNLSQSSRHGKRSHKRKRHRQCSSQDTGNMSPNKRPSVLS